MLVEVIATRILKIRGKKVMLDRDFSTVQSSNKKVK